MTTWDALNNSILFMVRPFGKLTAHHKRNQKVTVHPELVEGFFQSIPRTGTLGIGKRSMAAVMTGNNATVRPEPVKERQ